MTLEMKKKITFKTWISVFFGGIRQFISNIFSWKNKTLFRRVVCSAITTCIVIITCGIIYSVCLEYKREYSWTRNEPISSQMNFSRLAYRDEPGWITNKYTGEVITRDVDWIQISDDEDSLAVFSSKGKRGYINRFSGKVAIAPKFDKAWTFSSGIAAVAKGNTVFFINHSGKAINKKTFTYSPQNSYAYHGDYCIMNDENDMQGLIDRSGNWKINPEYECISPAPHNYWKMRKGSNENGLWYAFTDKAEPVNSFGVKQLEISEDLGVVYSLPNHLKMVVDFNGNKMEKFLCRNIEALYYDTEQRDTTNNFIPAKCTLYRYRMDDGYEGLCRENGDIVTEPLYWNISAVGKDIYHCSYHNSEVGVIINSKGEVTKL